MRAPRRNSWDIPTFVKQRAKNRETQQKTETEMERHGHRENNH